MFLQENKDINWIFMFCKSCWEYEKFEFKEIINFNLVADIIGECKNCHNKKIINTLDIKNHYEELNKDNN